MKHTYDDCKHRKDCREDKCEICPEFIQRRNRIYRVEVDNTLSQTRYYEIYAENEEEAKEMGNYAEDYNDTIVRKESKPDIDTTYVRSVQFLRIIEDEKSPSQKEMLPGFEHTTKKEK